MHRAKVRHIESVCDRDVPRAVEIDRRPGFEAKSIGIDGLKIRNRQQRKFAGMEKDHPVLFGHDAIARIAVFPMVQRAADAVADDFTILQIDTLMTAVCRQCPDGAVVSPAKENDGKFAEIEAEDVAGRERFGRRDHVPPGDQFRWPHIE